MRYLSLALSAASMMPGGAALAQDHDQRIEWNRPAAPFRIVDNVHYVGTAGLAAYLITDPKGHVLIDGGLPQSAPLLAYNIRALGFRVVNVIYLLITVAHFVHSDARAAHLELPLGQLGRATRGHRG